MARVKANAEWTVLQHGPIEKLTENLWRVEGALPGMSLRRQMIVVRLGDGRLVVHNAMALEESAMNEIEAWGTPAFLLVPNGWHRLDGVVFKRRYPNAKVLTPKGSRKKAEECLAVEGAYEDFPADPAVRLETLHGVKEIEGVMLVRSNDGTTVVLNDAMFNLSSKPRDAMGWLFATVMNMAPGPRVSRLFKMLGVKDGKALRADFERFAAMGDLQRVVVAHGDVATGKEAANVLRAAAAYL
jgi:hypothetical protein